MCQNERGEAYFLGDGQLPDSHRSKMLLGRVDDFAVPSASCFGVFGLVIDRVHFRA